MAKFVKYIPLYSNASSTTNTSYSDLGTRTPALWDADNYDGTVTVYFEAVISTTGGTGYAALYGDNGEGQVSGSEVTTTSATRVRVRSGAITLTDGVDYVGKMKATSTFTTTITDARLVIVQSGSITKTETQILISGGNPSVTSTSVVDVATSPLFFYDADQYDGTVAIYLETVGLIDSGASTATWYLTDDANNAVTDGEISTNSTTVVRQRSAALTLVDGTTYKMRYKVTGSTGRLRHARLIIVQTGSPTKTETYYPMTAHGSLTTTSTTSVAQVRPIYWDDSEWSVDTQSVFFEATIQSSNASHTATAEAWDGAAIDATVSTTSTSRSRQRSAAFNPDDDTTYDPRLKISNAASTATMRNAWLVIQYTWSDNMTVENTVSDGVVGTNQTRTTSFTVASGSNRLLIVAVGTVNSGTGSADITSVTYNSVGLTQANTTGASTDRASIFYLIAPDTGTHDIVVTPTGGADGVQVAAYSIQGADQTTPIDASNQATDDPIVDDGTTSHQNLTVTSVTADALLISAFQYEDTTRAVTEYTGSQSIVRATASFGSGYKQLTTATGYEVGWSVNDGTSGRGNIAGVAIRPAATGVTLTVQDATITSSTDNIALTQKHLLTVADLLVTSRTDNAVLTQKHTLAMQDALVTSSSDNIALTQKHTLAVADAVVSSSSDNVALTQKHMLAVNDAVSTSSADNIALTQKHTLALADMALSTSLDPVTLIEDTALVIADLTITSSSDNVVLTQKHTLAVADARSTSSIDAPALTQKHLLVVADLTVSSSTDNATLTQKHTLAVQDALISSTADNTTLTQKHSLAVADALITSRTDNVALLQDYHLAVADLLITSSIDNVVIILQTVTLSVADLLLSSSIDSFALTQKHTLDPDDALISMAMEAVAVSTTAVQIYTGTILNDGGNTGVVNDPATATEIDESANSGSLNDSETSAIISEGSNSATISSRS